MSRIGLKPIEIPSGVEVKVDGQTVNVKGPKGELTKTVHESMNIIVEDQEVIVERADERKQTRSLHGTTRSLIANMIEGVHKGFEKKLEIIHFTIYYVSFSSLVSFFTITHPINVFDTVSHFYCSILVIGMLATLLAMYLLVF